MPAVAAEVLVDVRDDRLARAVVSGSRHARAGRRRRVGIAGGVLVNSHVARHEREHRLYGVLHREGVRQRDALAAAVAHRVGARHLQRASARLDVGAAHDHARVAGAVVGNLAEDGLKSGHRRHRGRDRRGVAAVDGAVLGGGRRHRRLGVVQGEGQGVERRAALAVRHHNLRPVLAAAVGLDARHRGRVGVHVDGVLAPHIAHSARVAARHRHAHRV